MNQLEFMDQLNAAAFVAVAIVVVLLLVFAVLAWIADWLLERDTVNVYPHNGLDFGPRTIGEDD